MRHGPTTLEEAQKHRYGSWAGMPDGVPWRAGDCAESIMPNERWAIGRQCGNKAGFGPSELFCRKHGDPRMPGYVASPLLSELKWRRTCAWNAYERACVEACRGSTDPKLVRLHAEYDSAVAAVTERVKK